MNAAELSSKIRESVSVGTVYGPAVARGDRTLIPAAWVAGGGGFGFGDPQGEAVDAGSGGGGFGVFAFPLGAWELTDGGTRFRPAHTPLMWAWALAMVVKAASVGVKRVRKASAKAPVSTDAAGE